MSLISFPFSPQGVRQNTGTVYIKPARAGSLWRQLRDTLLPERFSFLPGQDNLGKPYLILPPGFMMNRICYMDVFSLMIVFYTC